MQTPVCDSDSELWAMSEGGLQCVHLALGASNPTTCPLVRSLQLAWSSALALGGCLIPKGTAGGTWRRGALAPSLLKGWGKTRGRQAPSPVNTLEPPRLAPYSSRVAPKLQHPHPQESVRPSGPPPPAPRPTGQHPLLSTTPRPLCAPSSLRRSPPPRTRCCHRLS